MSSSVGVTGVSSVGTEVGTTEGEDIIGRLHPRLIASVVCGGEGEIEG